MTYAKETTVSVDRSLAEIKSTLQRYGATAFGYLETPERAQIAFEIRGRRVRIGMPLPSLAQFRRSPAGRPRTAAQERAAWEQSCRQRWRALLLVIKAKLEATEAGISTIEQEFLAWIALPNGETIGEWLAPQIEDVYEHGRMPALLPRGDQ